MNISRSSLSFRQPCSNIYIIEATHADAQTKSMFVVHLHDITIRALTREEL